MISSLYREQTCTANIFNVIFTIFTGVPLSTVIPLYYLHLIAAPSIQLNNCKADLQFFYCNFYIGLYKAIKYTVRLQWKVEHN